jgi:hypothetical protein
LPLRGDQGITETHLFVKYTTATNLHRQLQQVKTTQTASERRPTSPNASRQDVNMLMKMTLVRVNAPFDVDGWSKNAAPRIMARI